MVIWRACVCENQKINSHQSTRWENNHKKSDKPSGMHVLEQCAKDYWRSLHKIYLCACAHMYLFVLCAKDCLSFCNSLKWERWKASILLSKAATICMNRNLSNKARANFIYLVFTKHILTLASYQFLTKFASGQKMSGKFMEAFHKSGNFPRFFCKVSENCDIFLQTFGKFLEISFFGNLPELFHPFATQFFWVKQISLTQLIHRCISIN